VPEHFTVDQGKGKTAKTPNSQKGLTAVSFFTRRKPTQIKPGNGLFLVSGIDRAESSDLAIELQR
jgi:hypothetical protein